MAATGRVWAADVSFLTDYSFVRDSAGNMYFADRGRETEFIGDQIVGLGRVCLAGCRFSLETGRFQLAMPVRGKDR